MGNTTTRIYRNDSKNEYSIPGIGVIEAGGQVSITSEFQTPVNLQNYPDLVDVLAEEAEGQSNIGKAE